MAAHTRSLLLLVSATSTLFTAVGAATRETHLNRDSQHKSLVARQAADALPAGWTNEGCWVDNAGGRSLGEANLVSQNMTQEMCVNHCNDLGWAYAGVEYSAQCFCDDYIRYGGKVADDPTTCSMACAGNPAQIVSCGGPARLTLFYSNVAPPPPPAPPAIVPSYGLWESLGCYSEGEGGRTLPFGVNSAPFGGGDNMTVQNCADACLSNGYPIAGIEYSVECYCGTEFLLGGAPATDDACTAMTCKGNSSQYCGGPDRLQAYHYTGTITTPPTPIGGGGGGGDPAPPAGPPPPPQTEDLVQGWNYISCYNDGAAGRALTVQKDDDNALTPNGCIEFCASKNLTIAGMEFSFQCFCDKVLHQGVTALADSQCNMGCAGNSSVACGAGGKLSVYASTPTVEVLPIPTAKTTGLPAGWEFQNCLIEPDFPAPRMFPYKLVDDEGQDINTCLSKCQKYGYPAAGLEYGNECWCGDIEQVAASPGVAALSDCNFPCPGSPTDLCGAGNRLLYYEYKGAQPLYEWHRPNVTGRYEFLVGGPIVPLQTTLGINNKVTFLEKLGSGPQNSTHAYELDVSLAHDITKAWREMHVKTDVFCSAGVVMPDKAGRQINVGGWSLDSTFGVRLYTPNGELGTNSTNDWEENFEEVALQIGRWYPTSLVLSNGSILVMGGQRGANDIPVPSIEILPRPAGGPTLLELAFLREFDPYNLYPFLYVLPLSGEIFVIGHNDARNLNPKTFVDVRVHDRIPGSVDEGGGRTYPNSGAAMMLPLHPPYTEPAQILTCGGTPGGGAKALDNCAIITPEATDAHWQLERMPFRRVMACMVNLPDGTFLIVNGAQKGAAGFGLADSPTLTALLYDPTLPIGQRMSILNTTIVARMYHSEAILLHDGRVLITGSDPLTTVLYENGTVNWDLSYPEEYRTEVYYPPYLSTGRTQPTYTITNTDWAYGAEITINVNLFHGTTGTMRVSLLGAVVSTHANSMGQRHLWIDTTCTGNVCKLRAPPNNKVWPPGWGQLFVLDGPTPSYSQWVRVGGDPARLGEWPQLPDFTTPGL
ncbi:glyoxal oxidase N-terminus-domain-containing protein [Auriculariales sp. MPI-PUGE-AT-0066]|nr:glyoxal oxidase N-terminus-domain-containing protein [Auriculariales sp. MPI-PUGE-AT-0066]